MDLVKLTLLKLQQKKRWIAVCVYIFNHGGFVEFRTAEIEATKIKKIHTCSQYDVYGHVWDYADDT